MTFDSSGPEPDPTSGLHANVCVRDVSWHSQVSLSLPMQLYESHDSQEPVLMSAGWESGRGGSIVARHEWKGLSKLHGSLEDWVEKNSQERSDASSTRRSRRLQEQRVRRRAFLHVPGAFDSGEEDE